MTTSPNKYRRRTRKPSSLVVTAVGVAAGIATAASVAFAASLPVATASIATSSTSASVAESTCTLAPSADAALDRETQGSNYGGLAFLAVRAQNGNNQRRSLVRFDVSSCAIPSGAIVRSATLNVTVISGPGSSRNYGAHRVTAPWAENSVTYLNQPAHVAGATSTIATGAAPASLSWSVLSDVSGIVNGTLANNGWLMRDSNESANPSIETVFGSRENGTAANRPSLVISYYP